MVLYITYDEIFHLMRQLIIKLGRTKTVIAVTAVSVLLSVIITLFCLFIFGEIGMNSMTFVSIFIAIIVPLIVASSVSSVITGMLFEIHKLETEMRILATYDSLTGLLNRRAFIEQVNCFFRTAERQKLEFSILIVDLDHFKKINDQYGHAGGDRVLESFGKIISNISRKSDLAGRIGGEEFAFFLPYTSAEKAYNFAECLHQAMKDSVIEYGSLSIQYTASIGLAFFPKMLNIEEALSIADKALYRAKKNGRNQSVMLI